MDAQHVNPTNCTPSLVVMNCVPDASACAAAVRSRLPTECKESGERREPPPCTDHV